MRESLAFVGREEPSEPRDLEVDPACERHAPDPPAQRQCDCAAPGRASLEQRQQRERGGDREAGFREYRNARGEAREERVAAGWTRGRHARVTRCQAARQAAARVRRPGAALTDRVMRRIQEESRVPSAGTAAATPPALRPRPRAIQPAAAAAAHTQRRGTMRNSGCDAPGPSRASILGAIHAAGICARLIPIP